MCLSGACSNGCGMRRPRTACAWSRGAWTRSPPAVCAPSCCSRGPESMRPGSLAILGIAAYSVFLVATMPARWAAERGLAKPGPVALHDIEGTIWHGNARAAIGTAGTIAIDRIEWRFLPSRLLQGRVAYDASMKGAGFEARGELGRTFAGWSLRDLSGRSQAAIATAILPWLGPWRPEGAVAVAAPALDIAGREVRGELRIDWTDAATALSEVRPLGA